MSQFNENESLLVNPEDIELIRKREEIARKFAKPQSVPEVQPQNLGQMVKVEFESEGRFDAPEFLYANDYKAKDLNSIYTSRQEDMIETVGNFLEKSWDRNSLPSSHKNFSTIGDLLIEEFFELMVGLKMQFDSPLHVYRWSHDCQNYLHRSHRKLSTFEFDLNNLKYRNIKECDAELRELFAEGVKDLDKTRFEALCVRRFGEYTNQTKEQLIQSIRIEEPVSIFEGVEYKFRLQRLKDVIYANRRVNKEFSTLVRSIQNKNYGKNISQDEERAIREQELEEVQMKKAEKALDYSSAMMLLSVNGKLLNSEDEKIKAYSEMPRSVIIKLSQFMEIAKFGIVDEREVECDLCHVSETRRFPRDFSPTELLLPYESNNKSDSKRKLSKSATEFIYFGI